MELLTSKKIASTFTTLRDAFSWSNAMQAPRIEKVVVSVGTGRARKDKQKIDLIQDRLAHITGQKPAPRRSRVSIASFKLREGEVVGYAVTLRGKRMLMFLDRLIHVALPRTRDFRGIPRTSVDEMGNLTIGIREHIIFPEVPDENLQDIFGLSITVVLSTSDRKEAVAFLEHVGIPFVRS